MSFPSPRIDLHPTHWEIVKHILKKHVPNNEVWAFGSRVTGRAKPYSDLDLCIITDKPLSLSTISALNEAFSASDLPWKVDVIDWSLTSDLFRKVIEKDKIILQTGPDCLH